LAAVSGVFTVRGKAARTAPRLCCSEREQSSGTIELARVLEVLQCATLGVERLRVEARAISM
jgi:hypothetical protein